MTQVTVRAEQAFADWALGEVRTIARTPVANTLIADGRVSVLEEHANPEPKDNTDGPPDVQDVAAESEQPGPQARAGRRRPDKG
jgi:hypothetical protein